MMMVSRQHIDFASSMKQDCMEQGHRSVIVTPPLTEKELRRRQIPTWSNLLTMASVGMIETSSITLLHRSSLRNKCAQQEDVLRHNLYVLEKRCARVLKMTNLSEQCVHLGLLYMAKLAGHPVPSTRNGIPDVESNTRFVQFAPHAAVFDIAPPEWLVCVVGLMFADMFLNDINFSTASWSKASGVPVSVLKLVKRHALISLDFNLTVQPNDYKTWRDSFLPLWSEEGTNLIQVQWGEMSAPLSPTSPPNLHRRKSLCSSLAESLSLIPHPPVSPPASPTGSTNSSSINTPSDELQKVTSASWATTAWRAAILLENTVTQVATPSTEIGSELLLCRSASTTSSPAVPSPFPHSHDSQIQPSQCLTYPTSGQLPRAPILRTRRKSASLGSHEAMPYIKSTRMTPYNPSRRRSSLPVGFEGSQPI